MKSKGRKENSINKAERLLKQKIMQQAVNDEGYKERCDNIKTKTPVLMCRGFVSLQIYIFLLS